MKPLLLALLLSAGAAVCAQQTGARAALQARRQAIDLALRSGQPADLTQALEPLAGELDAFAKERPQAAALLPKAKADLAAALAAPAAATADLVETDLANLLAAGQPASARSLAQTRASPNAKHATAAVQGALSCANGAFDGGACGARTTPSNAVSAAGASRSKAVVAPPAPAKRSLDSAAVPAAPTTPSPQTQACLQAVAGYASLA